MSSLRSRKRWRSMARWIFSEPVPFDFIFTVGGYSGPALTVAPSTLGFSLTQNGTASTQSVGISNHGGAAGQFSASVENHFERELAEDFFNFGLRGCLRIGFSGCHSRPIAIAGRHVFGGAVTISIPGSSVSIVSVVAVVSGTQPTIELSQTGLRFQAVSGGTATSPQTITVLNPGAGTLNFSASVSTISGGNWLSVSPSIRIEQRLEGWFRHSQRESSRVTARRLLREGPVCSHGRYEFPAVCLRGAERRIARQSPGGLCANPQDSSSLAVPVGRIPSRRRYRSQTRSPTRSHRSCERFQQRHNQLVSGHPRRPAA